MASTYSPNLRLELIGTGEQQGTWGITTNTNLGTLLEEAIGGYVSVPVTDGADTTLTTANGAVDQSRNMTINLTGALTAARNVICPAIEKIYIVKNATSGGFAVTFKVSGQTGVTIPNGSVVFIYVDGTDARSVTGSIASQAASAVAITGGTVNVGDAQAPRSDLQMTATTTPTAVVVGSISGTTLTVTAVTSGTLAVGNRLFVAGLDYNIYITAFGSGSGLTGTYIINQTETLASTTINAYPSAYNTLTFYEKDTAVDANQPIGGIEWFGSDSSTPGGGVKAYIAAINESTTPDTALLFGTSDNSANTLAVERMRIDSSGNVGIGGTPNTKLDVNGPSGVTSFTGTTKLGVMVRGSTATTDYSGIDFTGASGSTPYARIAMLTGASGSVLQLGTSNNYGSGVTNSAVNIDPSGNVGIGVSPSVRLDVASGSAALATNFNSTNASGVYVRFQNSGTAIGDLGSGGNLFSGGTAGDFGLTSRSGNLVFGTSSTERMRIDSSGNVGIGAAPTASQGRLQAINTAITGGSPAASGTTDANQLAAFQAGSVQLRFGVTSPGDYWLQPSLSSNYATNTNLLLCPNGGNVTVNGSGGLGYGTGSGGTVTQATSKSTGVTLNKTNGQITMNNAALAANTIVSFVVTNSTVSATDTVIINIPNTGINTPGKYRIWAAPAAGSFNVYLENATTGSLSDALVLNFSVIKSTTS